MRRDRYWLWVVPLMLIMSALVVPRLGYDGLWLDEWYSVRNSGGALYGPLGVWGIVQRVVETDSTQALGYPLMLGAWGWFAGWTAFAGRVSSWLVGVLTVAMGYRLGHLVLGKRGGVYTALLLALGAFFVYFSHELRAYMLMAFFCCALVWAYIRLLQEHKAQTGWIQAIFVVSGAGLLWAHYYSAILLIGLGIYHVVFAEKNRRWWQVIGLAMLVGISFLPQVPGFLQGFQTYEPSDLGAVPLTSVEVLQSLIYYAGNGWGLFAIILLSMGMWYAFAQKQLALRVIIALSVLTIAVLVIANVALEILEPRRMRYAVFILPLCCVWIAGGMVALDSWLERLPIRNNLARIVLLIVPCLWLANGLRANVDTTFTDSLEAEPIPPFREIVTAIEGQVGASDLLALYNGDGGDAFYIRNTFELATYELSLPYLITSNVFADETRDWALEIVADTDRVWYVVNRTIPRNEIHTDFVALLDADFVLCRTVVDEDNIAVTLWVRDVVFCLQEEAIIHYESRFTLAGSVVEQSASTIEIRQGWQIAPNANPQDYSLGVYVVNATTEEIVLQADDGFPIADFFAVTHTFEDVLLPNGDYEVRVVVYRWEDGVRLEGLVQTGEVGDYLGVNRLDVGD